MTMSDNNKHEIKKIFLTGRLLRPVSGRALRGKLSILVLDDDDCLTHHMFRFNEDENPHFRFDHLKDRLVTVSVEAEDDENHIYPLLTSIKVIDII